MKGYSTLFLGDAHPSEQPKVVQPPGVCAPRKAGLVIKKVKCFTLYQLSLTKKKKNIIPVIFQEWITAAFHSYLMQGRRHRKKTLARQKQTRSPGNLGSTCPAVFLSPPHIMAITGPHLVGTNAASKGRPRSFQRFNIDTLRAFQNIGKKGL